MESAVARDVADAARALGEQPAGPLDVQHRVAELRRRGPTRDYLTRHHLSQTDSTCVRDSVGIAAGLHLDPFSTLQRVTTSATLDDAGEPRRKGAQKRAKEEFGFVFEEKKSDDDEERFLHVESTMGSPEDELVFDEDSLELMNSLQQLSGECRDIIKKRYYDDLSYKEICDELGLPLGTVCSRLKRCLLRLKEIYVEKYGKV